MDKNSSDASALGRQIVNDLFEQSVEEIKVQPEDRKKGISPEVARQRQAQSDQYIQKALVIAVLDLSDAVRELKEHK